MTPLPVVLVHGLRTSSTMWDQQLPILKATGRSVHTPDLPGHGTRRDDPFTPDTAVAVVADALAAADEGEGVALVGCSLGGMVAIHAAATAQEHVESLVAVNCATQPGRRTAGLYGLGIRALHGLPGAPARAGGPLLRRLLGEAGAAAYVRGGTASDDAVRSALAAVAGWDLRSDLARIHVPVTILSSRFDQLRLQERSFAAAAPHGRLVVLPHGTHLAPLAQPDRWTAALVRVLDPAAGAGQGR
ncbi:alpha/beta hydrolase [Tessaracoccus terricola]